jgi:hypothetical protein
MTNLEKNYREAVNKYRELSDQWNALIDGNVHLGNHTWERLLTELEDARDNVRKAWNEFLNKELYINPRAV